jgi:hypothetical protein
MVGRAQKPSAGASTSELNPPNLNYQHPKIAAFNKRANLMVGFFHLAAKN